MDSVRFIVTSGNSVQEAYLNCIKYATKSYCFSSFTLATFSFSFFFVQFSFLSFLSSSPDFRMEPGIQLR